MIDKTMIRILLILCLSTMTVNAQDELIDSISSPIQKQRDSGQFANQMAKWEIPADSIMAWKDLPHGPQVTKTGDTLEVDYIQFEDFYCMMRYKWVKEPLSDDMILESDTLYREPWEFQYKKKVDP